MSRVSEFLLIFVTKNPNLKNKYFFFFLGGGGAEGADKGGGRVGRG